MALGELIVISWSKSFLETKGYINIVCLMLSRWRTVASSSSSEKVYRFSLVTWYVVVFGLPSVVFNVIGGRNVYILKTKEKLEWETWINITFWKILESDDQKIWEGSWERIRLIAGRTSAIVQAAQQTFTYENRTAGKERREQFGTREQVGWGQANPSTSTVQKYNLLG